jgi:hypothetical protein
VPCKGLDRGRLGGVGAFSVVCVGGLSGLVVVWDVVVQEGFCVELCKVDILFLHNGISHEAC